MLGQDISSSSLWSASLIESDQGSKAIVQTHLDFLQAGADVVSTSTYQASTLAFQMAGHSSERAEQLLVKSVQLAQQARETFAQSNPQARKPLLLLSLGPYGSALSNGCECEEKEIREMPQKEKKIYTDFFLLFPLDTGDYFVPDTEKRIYQGPPVSQEDMEEFHFFRIKTIASSPTWSFVDVIAFETIPRLDEAIAIRRALRRIFSLYPRRFSYASFVFPKGNHLPWPVQQDESKDQDMNELLDEVLGNDKEGHASPLSGVGINCTKPKFLNKLVKNMTFALPQVKREEKPYLFVSGSDDVKKKESVCVCVCADLVSPLLQLYPDGGLVWDGIKRVWKEEKGTETSSLSWSDQVMNAADLATQKTTSSWGGCFVGGCCKATTSDIAALRSRVDAASYKQ